MARYQRAKIGAICGFSIPTNVVDKGLCLVHIGPGAKLFGRITIADKIAVGANAVVTKSFTEENISIGGVSAKRISDTGTEGIIK